MGWLFSLSAECGREPSPAHVFAAHFRGLMFALPSGAQSEMEIVVETDFSENYWAHVYPTSISASGVRDQQDARDMNAVAAFLYDRLTSAPGFRYALVGVEVGMCCEYAELLEDWEREGLVVSDEMWRRIGSPKALVPFGGGRWWLPYRDLSEAHY